MKAIFKLSVLLVFLLSAGYTSAQNFKFGHTDSQAVLASLNETKEAQKALEKEQKDIQDRLAEMQAEAQKVYADYLENINLAPESPEKWSQLVTKDKEAELQSLQQRIQNYQESARNTLAEKQNKLYQPILEKVQKAIKEVAKEGNFTYIFDVNSLLYFSADQSIDITPLLETKLGVIK